MTMTLHHMIIEIFTGDPEQRAIWKDGLVRELKNGADPNQVLADRTPLGVAVSTLRSGTSFNQEDAIGILIKGGANPLIHDEPLRYAANQAINSTGQASLLKRMMSEIRDIECNNEPALRSQTGQTGLMVILEACDPKTSHKLLCENPGILSKTAARDPWCSQTDDDGNTPLHALWSDNGSMSKLLKECQDHGTSVDNTWVSANACYSLSQYLVDRGAEMDTQNNEGVTPLQLCAALVKQGMPTNPVLYPISGMVLAEIERETLENGTATVSGMRSKAARL